MSTGHTRSRGSKGSITTSSNRTSQVSGNGTSNSTTSSPASATKAAAIARQASMAKKRPSPGSNAKPSTANKDATAAKSNTSSTDMLRNGLSGSSSSSDASVALQDTPSESTTTADDLVLSYVDTPDELSRLTREQLLALIIRERQDREEVETRLSTLSTEHATLSESSTELLKAQAFHETRLNESYASTERLEKELSEHMELLDSTNEALREAERIGREAQKRLSDQVELFESEQAKWQEIEQSLHNQISKVHEDHQALLAKQHTKSSSSEVESQVIDIAEEGLHSSRSLVLSPTPSHLAIASPTFQIPESTLEELQLLHTRISELSLEQTILQDEIIRLENEMEEIQRVNSDLQEQNENYEVLVSERMLAGLSAFTDSGLGIETNPTSYQGDSSRPPSSLDRLDEEDGLSSDDDDGDLIFETSGDGNISTGAVAANMTPDRLKRTVKKRQSMLGSGSGLDLEAELDRARQEEEEDRKKAEEQAKRKKDRDTAARRRANQSTATSGDGEAIPADVETLRKEVKLLRQENKGLSTYVSKILEKIIGIEGFERVLSVEKEPKPASTPTTTAQTPPAPPTPAKTSILPGSTLPSKMPPLRIPSTGAPSSAAAPLPSPTSTAPSTSDNKKKNRFSIDWFPSSLFKATSTEASTAGTSTTTGSSAPAPGLKPMRLTGGPAQKTPTVEEDEDDRRTRARLQSEMRLLGIETTSSPATQTGSPGSVRIGANRSPGQRGLSGTYATSPLPPNLPPKEADIPGVQHDARHESGSRTSELSDKSSDSPATETVKIRGHRKRPSASFVAGEVPGTTTSSDASTRARPTSIGLGLSYSKDSPTMSTGSTRSPSLKASNEEEDRRASAASQLSSK